MSHILDKILAEYTMDIKMDALSFLRGEIWYRIHLVESVY